MWCRITLIIMNSIDFLWVYAFYLPVLCSKINLQFFSAKCMIMILEAWALYLIFICVLFVKSKAGQKLNMMMKYMTNKMCISCHLSNLVKHKNMQVNKTKSNCFYLRHLFLKMIFPFVNCVHKWSKQWTQWWIQIFNMPSPDRVAHNRCSGICTFYFK